jgi:hypothetical protein
MNRFAVLSITVLSILLISVCAVAQEQPRTATDIFEGMIYYENDQLEGNPRIDDYHCTKTETTVRSGSPIQEIVTKDIFFMVPGYYLELIGEEPVFYRDVSDIGNHLYVVDLNRLRDTKIGDIDCYVIQMVPKDAAFRTYTKTYYVAQEDFRKVRTVSINANDELDDLTTEINYTYGEINGFMLLTGEIAAWSDNEGNVVATVTTEYTDYEFGIGLDEQFFASYRESHSINPPMT